MPAATRRRRSNPRAVTRPVLNELPAAAHSARTSGHDEQRAGGRQLRPDRPALQAAYGGCLPDLMAHELKVLFCGINPSLYSVAVGHHFARPGNRFWPTLHRAGFTPRLLTPEREQDLLSWGLGITNLVPRATASADELEPEDYRRGAPGLSRKVRRFRPGTIAFLGIGAYRLASGLPRAKIGPQTQRFAGANTWVLPNPSGINAHYQLADLVACYRELALAALS